MKMYKYMLGHTVGSWDNKTVGCSPISQRIILSPFAIINLRWWKRVPPEIQCQIPRCHNSNDYNMNIVRRKISVTVTLGQFIHVINTPGRCESDWGCNITSVLREVCKITSIVREVCNITSILREVCNGVVTWACEPLDSGIRGHEVKSRQLTSAA
jgi:hypothetical protein